MNIPDDYIAFARYFEITQFNFDFLDFLTIQDALNDETKGEVGHRSQTNMNFSNGNILVEYIYLFLIISVVIASHVIFKLLIRKKTFQQDSNLKIVIDFFNGIFEYKIYVNLVLYTSLIVFAVCWNQILGVKFNTVVNGIGFFVALLGFVGLTSGVGIPIFLASIKSKTNKIVNGAITEETIPEKLTFLDKFRDTINYGLKEKKICAYYNSVFLAKRIILAFALVTFSIPELQLIIFLLIQVAYTAYISYSRPFLHLAHNILAIINESVLICTGLLMFAFLAEGDERTGVSTTIIIFLIINLGIFSIVCGILYELYLVWNVMKVVTEVQTVKIVKHGVLKRYKTQYNGKNDLLKWKESIKKIREDAKQHNNHSYQAQAMSLSRSKDIYLDRNSIDNDNESDEEEVKLQSE
mmetsp:Transcript_8456/g.7472  ORF Transcript_8456/g.7472 Transcript_8456/m.7472 type:complete len:410 (-) Transcript_8456:47-1276(-)